jgi:adenylate cyclase
LALGHFFEKGRWGSPAETDVEGQSLNGEDQLFILMQAALYLSATRESTPEIRICYERAESLCHSLNHPRAIYAILMGQWRHSEMTDKQTATLQIAKRIYSLAQEQNEPEQMIGSCTVMAATLYHLGDFETAWQYWKRGVKLWRSEGVRSSFEEVDSQPVACLYHEGLAEWHFGEIATSRVTMAEAISLAKELNDMHGLALALYYSAVLGYLELNPALVEHLASDLIELSTRHNFAHLLAAGAVCRGWARSASGNTAAGIAGLEEGIRDYRAIGSIVFLPFFLALKAEALHLADRTAEALEAIREANALVERFENRYWSAELHRLRGVFLAALDADETQIEASFQAAISTAKEQKSVSLEKRAEATYAEYRRQKASGSGGRGFRLPLR